MHARMTLVTLGLLFIGLLLRPGPAVAVTPEMLVAEAAEEALAGTLEEGSEISVHFLSQLPGSVIGLNNFALDPRNGRFRADFITQEGMLEPAVGLAMVEVSLPVPKRRLDPGEIITAADLVEVRLPRVQVSSLALREVDALVGMQARRALAPGRPIQEHAIGRPIVAKRGESVNIVLREGAIAITAPGRLLEDGAEGELVRVINGVSNRTIQAYVVNAETVEIRL